MNKKAIFINLLIIISIISVSGCLESVNEDDIYNKEMSAISQDLEELNETMNKINSNNTDITSTLNEIDFAIRILNNDSQKLKDLNKTITNITRKEYIELWINYIETSKMSYIELKNTTKLIKNYKSLNMTPNEVMNIIENSYKLLEKYNKNAKSIEEQIKDYENKTPSVLINGTTPVYSFDIEKNIENDS